MSEKLLSMFIQRFLSEGQRLLSEETKSSLHFFEVNRFGKRTELQIGRD